MKNIIIAMALITGHLFALDEYLPIKEKTAEIDIGYIYNPITGGYDNDGKKQDLVFIDPFTMQQTELKPVINGLGFQAKYGVIAGLDIELAVPYLIMNEDAGDVSGLSMPSIGVKYAHPEMGVGGFIDVDLPFGSEDIVGTDPVMALTLGGIYGSTFDKLNLLANANYTLNFEDANGLKSGNTFEILAKPEFMVSDIIGLYLSILYDLTGETTSNGTGGGDNGYLLALFPGLNVAINDMIAFEANVPISVLGKNTGAFWALQGFFYITLGS